jgi:excisionase family DNA binding protein
MDITAPETRRTYTLDEVAAMLGISRGHCYEQARAGAIPGVITLGRRIMVSRSRFDAWLSSGDDEA